MTLDAHQHFWRYSAPEYPWMGAGMDALRRDYLPDDLMPLMRSAGVEGSIAVQARCSLIETQWLLSLADHNQFIQGVVGWVDLCSPYVEEQLAQFANNSKLKGIRHIVHDEPDDLFMLRPEFRRGIRALASNQLTYDLLIRPRHLPVAFELVQEFAEQKFVIDHGAKPFIRTGVLEPWRTDLAKLAECPNVYCKLSGLLTEADWANWKAADFTPYLEVLIELFGPSRLMVGSDWPVCTLAGTYGEAIGMLNDVVSDLSLSERGQIMGATCANFYGVSTPSGRGEATL